jgi:CubicO group peptidase (beta-lactamase class C family)
MRDHTRPTTLPFGNPLYSDASWGVLGVALERLSGLPYNDALHELLGKPLSLNGTSSILPPDEDLNAVILPAGPSEATAWGLDNPISAA